MPDRTIVRGSVCFVYFNSSLLVLLIFLTFLLSSLFCKVSCLVDRFVLHPLICSLLCYVAYERCNDFMKESALLGYASRWRGVGVKRRAHRRHGISARGAAPCVSQLPAGSEREHIARSELHPN